MNYSLFEQILALALMLFMIFLGYNSIKNNPQLLSKESISRSFRSMGFLALILIGFISFLVMMIPSGETKGAIGVKREANASTTPSSSQYRTV